MGGETKKKKEACKISSIFHLKKGLCKGKCQRFSSQKILEDEHLDRAHRIQVQATFGRNMDGCQHETLEEEKVFLMEIPLPWGVFSVEVSDMNGIWNRSNRAAVWAKASREAPSRDA